jgi:cell division septum initiation protein DivIVA
MPDENQASTEHTILQEISEPLQRLPEDAVAEAADVDFPVVLRGYDRMAVDAYVRRTTELIAELQATRSPEAAVRRALERVGDEVSGILQRAHETAAQITATSRTEAEDRLEQARVEAREIAAAGERRVKELDAETDRIWAERQRIVEDTQQLAHQLLGLAESAAERFPAEEPPVGEPTGTAATGPVRGVDLPGEEPTVAAPYPGDVTAPTVAFPVPFGEEAFEGAEEEAHPEPVDEGDADPTVTREQPRPGVGAVPAPPEAGEEIGEPSGEPRPEEDPPRDG